MNRLRMGGVAGAAHRPQNGHHTSLNAEVALTAAPPPPSRSVPSSKRTWKRPPTEIDLGQQPGTGVRTPPESNARGVLSA
jgi:hypothetical protein